MPHTQASPHILAVDKILMPVHCGQVHWAAACIDLAARKLGFNRDRLDFRTDRFTPPCADSQLGLFPAEPRSAAQSDRAAYRE